jgi:hypothetical protein
MPIRSKVIVTLLGSWLVIQSAMSQTPELLVQGQTGKLYLEHTVATKENWYSIGRLYNVDAKVLAAYNHHAFTKPLSIGELLQVPLNAANFSQTGQKTPGMTLVPVYHIIQEKEWLYRISVNHNKVPVASLEKWNNTDKDHAYAGMHLIVGFLKVKTSLSALANPALRPPAAVPVPAPVPAPVATTTTATTTTATTTVPGVSAPTGNSNGAVKPPAGQSVGQPGGQSGAPAIHFNGGYFRSEYGETGKSMSGTAGIFKSTSGWQDGKYYALMNNVPVGTIVKVTASGSGKSVYTKVLGGLPDMKESTGLSIRISNAAAGELGEAEGKFQVDVKY